MDFTLQFTDDVRDYELAFSKVAHSEKDVGVRVGDHTYFISGDDTSISLFTTTIQPLIGASHASLEQLRERLSKAGIKHTTTPSDQKNQAVALALLTPTGFSLKDLQASMAAKDLPTFMHILMNIAKEDVVPIKSALLAFMEEHRKELCQYVSVKPFTPDKSVRCALRPLPGDGAPYFGVKIRDTLMCAENIVLYELKDGSTRIGYAVVAKNVKKIKSIAEYREWLSQKKEPVYEVTYITTEKAHQGKGLAYMLLYRVLSDKLSPGQEKGAKVTLLDQSGAAGTKLYLSVGTYQKGKERVEEFSCFKNSINEYFYRAPE